MLSYLIAFGFWLVGLFVGSYGLIQALICVRVGRGATNAFKGSGFLSADTAKKIKRKTNTTILFLMSCVAAVTALIVVFASSTSVWGYGIGVGFSFLLGIGSTGTTQSNLMQYLAAYSRLMPLYERVNLVAYFNDDEATKILGFEDKAMYERYVTIQADLMARSNAEMAAENEAQ